MDFDKIEVIEDNDDVLVINKPPSVPVHESGKFRKNSLLRILESEFCISNLKPIHRLDRVTTGVLMLGKTKSSTNKFG